MAGFAAAADYFPADLWLSHRLQDVDADAFSEALNWASRLADMPLVVLVALGAALALALLVRHLGAMWLVAALVVSLANTPVKLLVDRPRPAGNLVQVSEKTASASFPSGHVTAAVLVYGFIFYLAGFLIPALSGAGSLPCCYCADSIAESVCRRPLAQRRSGRLAVRRPPPGPSHLEPSSFRIPPGGQMALG